MPKFSNVSKPPSEPVAPPAADARIKGFLAAMNDDTDFTIALDQPWYNWRTHAKLLAQEASFFKTLMEGPWKEKNNQLAELHDDNPWMIGRMLQFFYQGSFDYKHDTGQALVTDLFDKPKPPPHSGLSMTLLMVMSRAIPNTDTIYENIVDSHLTEMEIDAAMYTVADKYGAAKLKAYVLESLQCRYAGYDMLVKICQGDFRNLIDEDEKLKLMIADKIAFYYKELREKESDWLEAWLLSDPLFALLIMDRMKEVAKPTKTVNSTTENETGLSNTAQPVQAKKSTPSQPADNRGLFGASRPVQANASAPSRPASGSAVNASQPTQIDVFASPRPTFGIGFGTSQPAQADTSTSSRSIFGSGFGASQPAQTHASASPLPAFSIGFGAPQPAQTHASASPRPAFSGFSFGTSQQSQANPSSPFLSTDSGGLFGAPRPAQADTSAPSRPAGSGEVSGTSQSSQANASSPSQSTGTAALAATPQRPDSLQSSSSPALRPTTT